MSRPLRVCSVYRTLGTGGDENRLLSLARALDRSRFEHLVAVAFPPGPDEAGDAGPMLEEYRRAGVEVLHLDDQPQDGPGWARVGGALARVTGRLVQLLRARAIDVVDARLAAAIPFAALAGRLAGVPVVGTQYHFDAWDRPARRALAESFWPLLDVLVCDSRARLEDLLAFVRRPPRGVVIPNGIEPPPSARGEAEMRRAFGLPEDPQVPVVGQVSRLVRFKGQMVLLEAARAVLARRPDAFFLLCGFARERGYREELQRRAAALGIAERVRVASYGGPVGDVWRAIDVHAHPSLFDSSPLAILEGMALGKPAVVTRVGGIPELVEHGQTGLVVPAGNAAALSGGLLRLLDDPALGARLGRGARARYEARHRPERMARATEALFAEVGGR